jgi:hypothetical protein
MLYGYKRKTKPAPWVNAGMSSGQNVKRFLDYGKRQSKYGPEAREFVQQAIARGETCPVVAAIPELRDGRKYGHPICATLNEVHHIRGRLGGLLIDKRGWLALSKIGHRWVHSNIEEARRRGWICKKGEWNTPFGG